MKGVKRHHVHVFQTSGVMRSSWCIATAAAAATACCWETAALGRGAAHQGCSALQRGGSEGSGAFSTRCANFDILCKGRNWSLAHL